MSEAAFADLKEAVARDRLRAVLELYFHAHAE